MPTNIPAVKRFHGLCGYFRDFIPYMSTRAQALRSLLKKGVLFQWTEETDREFQDLKQAITGPDVMLYHPNWNALFELHLNASKLGCGASWLKRRMAFFAPSDFHPKHLHQLNHVGQLCTRNCLQGNGDLNSFALRPKS